MYYVDRKVVLTVIVLLSCVGSLSAQQEFPLVGFFAETKEFFSSAAELELNRLFYPGGSYPTQSDQIEALDSAHVAGLKLVLGRAVYGSGLPNCLEHFCRCFWTNWEVDSSNFEHDIGFRVHDPFAHGDDAWKVTHTMRPGVMARGPTRPTVTRNFYYQEFSVVFSLKINRLDPAGVPVCSLTVFIDDPDAQPAESTEVITSDMFNLPGVYQNFEINLNSIHGGKRLSYEVYWFSPRNIDLWCDTVATRCEYIDDLLSGQYTNTILQIIETYKDHSAFDRFYLLDEPDIGNYAANRFVMDTVISRGACAIQVQNWWDDDIFENYVDSVKPLDLVTDIYPLNPQTPYSGPQFQGRLTHMCNGICLARKAAKQNNIPLGFTCQAFGVYDTTHPGPGSQCESHRLPTFSELRCMAWLALAHGAKGIWYFIYETVQVHQQPGWWYCGLINIDGSLREPIASAAEEINSILDGDSMPGIGGLLLSLISDTVFVSYEIPSTSYITSVSADDTMHVGIFLDPNQGNDYFMLVNRHCWPESGRLRLVTIVIDMTDIYLKDVLTGDTILTTPNQPGAFDLTFESGQGRLFQIMHQAERGSAQSFAPYLLTTSTTLHQITPQPIYESANISYALAKRTHVKLHVFNVVGRRVQTLVDMEQEGGYYRLAWSCGRSLPAGVYFLEFRADDAVEVRKVVLAR